MDEGRDQGDHSPPKSKQSLRSSFLPACPKGKEAGAFSSVPHLRVEREGDDAAAAGSVTTPYPQQTQAPHKAQEAEQPDDRVEGSLVPGSNPTKPWPAALPSPVLEEDSTVWDGKIFFFFVFSLICRNIVLKYVPKTKVNSSTSLDL